MGLVDLQMGSNSGTTDALCGSSSMAEAWDRFKKGCLVDGGKPARQMVFRFDNQEDDSKTSLHAGPGEPNQKERLTRIAWLSAPYIASPTGGGKGC